MVCTIKYQYRAKLYNLLFCNYLCLLCTFGKCKIPLHFCKALFILQ